MVQSDHLLLLKAGFQTATMDRASRFRRAPAVCVFVEGGGYKAFGSEALTTGVWRELEKPFKPVWGLGFRV